MTSDTRSMIFGDPDIFTLDNRVAEIRRLTVRLSEIGLHAVEPVVVELRGELCPLHEDDESRG